MMGFSKMWLWGLAEGWRAHEKELLASPDGLGGVAGGYWQAPVGVGGVLGWRLFGLS